jgi:queuosine precursor transporter
MHEVNAGTLDRNLASRSQYLWLLIMSYTMVIVLANWFNPRFVTLFGLNTDSGTLIFPLTFMLSDLITEVYGYKQARRAIWCGFFFNVMFVLYGQLVTHMPSPDFATHNAMFDELMSVSTRIIFASAISYFAAEPFNSYLMAKMKIKMKGAYMGCRFVLSTLVAAGLDSFIFTLIAFYGTMSIHNLLELAFTMWFIKVFIEIIGLPMSIRLAKRLKKAERLDVYDKRTKFTLLSLDDSYSVKDNEFKQEAA